MGGTGKQKVSAITRATLKLNYRMTEHQEQVAFVQWCDRKQIIYFAVPNGGFRHPATAVMLRAEGVKAGVPDLFFPHARGGFHGLFVEMKRPYPRGALSAMQQEWIDKLKKQGYAVEVAWGMDEAIRIVEDYLALP